MGTNRPTGTRPASEGDTLTERCPRKSWRLRAVKVSRPRKSAIVFAALAGLALSVFQTAPALGATCPNEARRAEQGSTYLPECRAFEQVSPPEKGETDAVSMGNEEGFPVQAAPDGRSLAFTHVAPLAGRTEGGGLVSPYISQRGAGGWETSSVAAPTPQKSPPGVYFSRYSFSPDLSRVTFTSALQQLVSGAPADVVNLYSLDRASGRYSLLSSAPPLVPVPPGCLECFNQRDLPAFQGASSDYSHSIFSANEGLIAGAPTGGGIENLYENVNGQVRLAGVLPDGAIPAEGATAGAAGQALLPSEPYFFLPLAVSISTPNLTGQIENAISEDGSRIIFSAHAEGGAPDPEQAGTVQLYDRVEGSSEGVTGAEGSSTLELSKPAAGAPVGAPAGPARFWAADPDGSLVLFTSRQALTGESNTGPAAEGSDLYMATVATVGGETSRTGLIDLASDPEGAGARVLGVVGTSEDLGYVYFVAEAALPGAGANNSGSNPIEGEPNLYVAHEGSLAFIATLARQPAEEPAVPNEPTLEPSGESGRLRPGDESAWTPQASISQAYVTPDGGHLAFMSINSLTGTLNIGQMSGRRVSEVYEYNAEDGSLTCASCEPDGGQPIGNAYLGARNNVEGNSNLTNLRGTGSPLHHPRFMNAAGSKLFFTSPDPGLLGEAAGERIPDTHGRVYVYSDGRASLISAVNSSLNEEFLDTSESGDDAFIATRSRLAPSDDDSNADVYDVKVDGGFAGSSTITCDGEAGCRAPAPSGGGSPSVTSEVVGPSGNLPAAKKAKQPSKLSKELARCKRLPAKNRPHCRALAKKRHGSKHKGAQRGKRNAHDHRRAH